MSWKFGSLAAAAAIDGTRLLDGRREDAESVVDGALGLVENLLRGAAQYQRARLAQRNARKAQQLVLANHDLKP